MDKIFVTKSSLPSMDEYIEEIKSIWDTCWLTNMGEKHNSFQEKLKEYLSVDNIELLVNGHMAIELTLQSMKLSGEVITTPFTFASTTHAIVRNGLKPVFCDIDKDYFTIDADKIEELINENTCAIVPVHVYGTICDVDKIDKIAKKYNIKVIYDAAHAFGEEYNGIGIGNYGDASCFSFHATKVFNSIEGGAVTFDNKEIGNALYGLKNFGIQGPEEVSAVGANAKLNEFCAAMGLCNLKHVEENIKSRKTIYNRYMSNLSNLNGIILKKDQVGVKSNYSYFPIVVDENLFGATREIIMSALEKEKVFARKYFYPLTCDFSAYNGRFSECDVSNARWVSNRVLTLPLFPDLDLADVDRICEIIKKCKN